MHLTFVEKGTPMSIMLNRAFEEGAVTYDATFYYLHSETSFYAKSEALYNDFHNIGFGDRMQVTFSRMASTYTFNARAQSILVEGSARLIHIEQLGGMEEADRRSDYRDEITISVQLFGLNKAEYGEKRFVQAEFSPAFMSETFDISSGGLCLVSNKELDSPFEPYFLCKFSLGNERFALPSKLVRKGNCPQTTLFRYDYGLFFLFEGIERERTRLTDAISDAKLSSYF